MRIFKKSLALALVMAMVLSLVSFGAFAETTTPGLTFTVKNGDATDATTITGAKAGKTIYVEVWLTPGTYTSAAVNLTPAIPVEDADVTSYGSVVADNAVKNDGTVQYKFTSSTTIGADQPIMVVKMTIPTAQDAGTINLFAPAESADNIVGIQNLTIGSSAFEVKESFEIGYVAPVTIDSQEVGVTAEEIIALLPTEVTVKASEAAESDDTVAVNAWTSEDFVANKVDTFTFATTNPSEEDVATGSFPVEVEVQVKPLVAVDTTSLDEKTVELKQKLVEGEVAAYTEEEFAAKVAELIDDATITVAKDGIEDTYNTPVPVIGDITNQEVGAEITATYTLEGASANGSFDLAEAKVITVTIVMAANEIKDGSFTWDVNYKTPSTSTRLKVEGTYEAKYAGKNVVITLTYGEDGVAAFEATLPELEQDAEAGEYSIEIGNLADVSNTISPDDVVVVEVTVDNVVAYYGEEASASLTVKATTAKKPGAGISQNISGPVNTPATEEPGTETPGTEEPGTEEPGTEEPGTEEPGTEEPGTDAPVTGTPVAGFTDVTTDHWAAEYIETMKTLGIVSGKSETSFEPEANITRAEFVKMIAVLADLELGETDVAFADCGADEWYTVYVAACVKAGYVNGKSETEFGANDMITREDICAILGRALDIPAADDAAFTDAADIADYAKAAVNALAGAKVLNGYEDGSFAPKANATRAEVCKIVSSLIAYAAEKEATEEAATEEATEEAATEEATEEAATEEATEEVAEEATEEAAPAEEAEEVVDEK